MSTGNAVQSTTASQPFANSYYSANVPVRRFELTLNVQKTRPQYNQRFQSFAGNCQRFNQYGQQFRNNPPPRENWRAQNNPRFSQTQYGQSNFGNNQFARPFNPQPSSYSNNFSTIPFRPRAPQQFGPRSNYNQSVNAVSSAGKGALQLHADVSIDGQLIPRALIDTGATFSMIPFSTYKQLRRESPILQFDGSPPTIVGVGGAHAEVKGYIDVPIEISGVEVLHPLIVVSQLAFPLLIGMDILRAHSANFSLGAKDSVRLMVPHCEICLETRIPDEPKFCAQPPVVTTLSAIGLKPFCVSTIAVRIPSSVLASEQFCVGPLPSFLYNYGCAVLPSVCSVSGGTCVVAVVSISRTVVNLREHTSIGEAFPVELRANSSLANVSAMQHLSREEKLKKVLAELHVDDADVDRVTKSTLRKFVAEFLDSFAKSDNDGGTTNLVFHEIDTGASRPLRQPARRLPYGEQRKAVESEISKLVDAGIARLSTSPWASPVVMVKKKDGGWRMCVDYRRLNTATKFDCFPLPRLDEALDAFSGAVVFSSLDLAMAYHQVPVAPQDVEKTAFITHMGLFEMAKMPFGLCNAPSTYQRLMSIVLQGLIGRICLAYLDDVIVFSKRKSDHLDDLREVFVRVQSGGPQI